MIFCERGAGDAGREQLELEGIAVEDGQVVEGTGLDGETEDGIFGAEAVATGSLYGYHFGGRAHA